MSSPATSVQAESRRACVNCADAKVKCVPRETGVVASCERCHRLNKVCGVRPRQARRRARKRGHVALAQKVDEIVALLAGRPGPVCGVSGSVTPAPGAAPPEVPRTLQTLLIDDAEAEALLRHFRQDQAPYSPFVEVAEDTTAASLRAEKPLLFLAIMMAASHDNTARQETFSRAAISLVADQLLVQGRKNLALLQGMLVLLNWYHTQIFVNPQITNLLHLSTALTTDLGLNQAPTPAETYTLSSGIRKAIYGLGMNSQERTLEERRAYAGCFYLASIFSTSFNIRTEMPWTTELDESCRILSCSGKDSDLRLVTFVRLQHTISQISQMQREITANGGLSAPLTVYITPFEESLTQLWDDSPETLRQNAHVQITHHAALMHLYKTSCLPPSPSPSPPPPRPADPATFVSLNRARHRCLASALACLDVLLGVPPERFYHNSVALFIQVGYAMITLGVLARCSPSPWGEDGGGGGGGGLPALLERVALHLDRSSAVVGDGGAEGDSRNARLVQWAAWLRMCIRRLEAEEGVVGDGAAGAGWGAVTPGEGVTGGGGDVAPGFLDTDGLGMDWAALADDISGLGLFGFADDALMGDFLAGESDVVPGG